MKTTVNTYGGLNSDTSYDSVPSNFYIDALDIRITTTSGESQGSITNIKGNVLSFTIPQQGGGLNQIIGTTSIRNTIILFVANNIGTNGWIYSIVYNEIDHTIFTGPTLIYTNSGLAFNILNPIEAVGRFESGKRQKIYWTDYNKPLRSLNIADPNVLTTSIDLIDIYPNINYVQPLLYLVSSGGTLLVGNYQIAYRLITFDGKQTLISPPSNMIHVVSDSETQTNSDSYTGDIKGTNSNKSISVTINVTEYHSFEKIELIVLFHEDFNGTPSIKSVETQMITSSNTVIFNYSGFENTTYPITTTDFALKSFPFSTCKTLTQVDNSLLIANLKSTSFDIQQRLTELGETFNAHTLRYNAAGNSMTGQPNFRSLLPGPPNYTADEVKFNTAYNEDAHWDSRWFTSGQYKYKSNGITLGGQGVNISYTFHLEPFFTNGSANPAITYVNNSFQTVHNLNDGYTYNNNTYDSNASPFISGLLRGYKRGEVYRFGIVFYNKKGQSSFVEYIGDIKFPDISEIDNIVNNSGTTSFPTGRVLSGSEVTAYSMGIKFTIDFSTCPLLLAEIESYQIVRVERTANDKKRICSGILRTFTNAPITAPPANGYDLRINGQSNVLHLATNLNNGNFSLLGTTAGDSTNHPLIGDRMTIYSPEISYDFDNVTASIVNANPLVLITGSFTAATNSSNTSTDTSAVEKLGKSVEDYRFTIGDVTTVNKTGATATYPTNSERRGVEYVKRFINKEKVTFNNALTDNNSDVAITTPLFDGFYMRNFYAKADPSDVNTNLNNPQTGVNNTVCAFYKGATGITGNIGKIQTDPLDAHNLNSTGSVSAFDYFDFITNVKSNYVSQDVQVLLDILLPKQEIYGGFNNSALETNVFIPASPIIDKANTNPIVFGGDVFLNMFTLQVSSTYNNPNYYDNAVTNQNYYKNRSFTQTFIVESCINIDVAHGSTLKTGVKFSVAGGASGIEHERYRQETNNSYTTYGKTLKMYSYNNVYSEQSSDLTFFVKPANLLLNPVNDIRAMLSNVKINDESIDSWTKFLVNNYLDVDDHGPINKVLKWKDNTYFFQDTAVGMYIINPVSLVTASSGNVINLGTGEGLINHEYLSTTNGSIHQWGIKDTEYAIYYFDAIAKKIFMLSGGNNPISEIKGIHGFLNSITGNVLLRKENGGDNPFTNKGVCIGKDNLNDEVLFTFKGFTKDVVIGDVNQKTIVYDELAQQFSSRYSITPSIYIGNKNVFLSPNPLNAQDIYIHNKGNYGNFYGVNQECFVQLVVNENADINKVLRLLEYNSIVRDSNKVLDRDSTITAFKIDTENQTTGKVPFSSDRFKHKFNKWRVKIPRDQNSVSQHGRLRNTYFIVTLYFDNSNNKELILNRLLTHYDIQMF